VAQQHNELRRAGEIDHAVRAIVGETDSDAKVERFGETLTPVLNVWQLAEWSFLRNEVLWSVGPQSSAAVALQSSFVQVFNPLGSNRIEVVTGAVFKTTVGGTDINLALTDTIRGASFDGAVALDTRFEENVAPTGAITARDPLSCSFGSLVPPFGSDLLIAQDDQVTAGIFQPFRNFPTIILAPGFGCVLSNSTVNLVLAVQFSGYGRPMRKDELG